MKDLIDKLQLLDIPRREGEVYLALLQKKEFTAPEIAKITSVSRTKAYEVLQNLVKKDLCNESFRNGIKSFSAVNPKIVLETILTDYEKKKKVADQLNKSLCEMYKEKEGDSNPLDYIEILTDVGQIRERFFNIQNNTKKQILVFTKPPYTNLTVEDTLDTETTVIENKVTAKSIYEYQGLNKKELNDLIRSIKKYEAIGEEARIIKELPMKMVISDDTITMFALSDRVSLKPSLTTMIVDHPDFAKAQKKVFETYWAEAIPIKDFAQNIKVN